MSFTYGFYESKNGDRSYKARQFARLFDGLITDGVFMTVGDCFAVKPNSGMSVSVGTGKAWFNHTWSENDTEMIVTTEESDMLLDRIDALVLEVDETESVRANSIKFITGTAATIPVKPTLTNTEYVHQHPLRYIAIPANSTEIKAENIENVVGTSECPFVTGVLEGMNIDMLVAQWEAQFDAWFEHLKNQLSGDVAGNLQNQIDVRWSLQGGTEITENADLNTYTTPGNYVCKSANTAATLTNAPITKVTFTLKVFDSTGSGVRFIQEFIPSSLDYVDIYPNRYVRSYYNGSWTAWDKIPYMSQVMPKTGGTFTGKVGYDTSHAGVVKNTQYSFRNIAIYSGSTAVASGNIRMVRK